MILHKALAWFVFLLPLNAMAAPRESGIALRLPDGELKGTLSLPASALKPPLVLFIAGSGPTDRDGNGPGMKNDSLKQLAHALAKAGIASVRYDKRGIGQSAGVGPEERRLTFEHYVDDAAAWLAFLKNDTRFSTFVILGHSEGSLIGMLAANLSGADGYVSVAGTSLPAAVLIRQQLSSKLSAGLLSESERILASLEQGKTAANVPAELALLFRPSVQPYLISWFKHDPVKVFSKVKAPSAVIQGTSDLQVNADAANMLHLARPGSVVTIVPGMNHVLKMATGGELAQLPAYVTPVYAVSEELTRAVATFVTGL